MRPVRLELRAFGSYPGTEVVDFDALSRRGLFAVTGPTGSGKTMIFDAMAWALYGVLPGQRQGDGDARSHHASSDVDTSVTLDFEVNGILYRIHRQPAWQRPKKRGEGTTLQPATATLVKVDGGGATHPEATSPKDCSQRCRDLVGLEPLEFQRVVLLPQGEFNRFLLSTDEDRERLLRNLFGGQLYERAVEWLKERVRRLDDEVRGIDVELQHRRLTTVANLKVATAAWQPEADLERLDSIDDGQLCAAIEELESARAAHQQAARHGAERTRGGDDSEECRRRARATLRRRGGGRACARRPGGAARRRVGGACRGRGVTASPAGRATGRPCREGSAEGAGRAAGVRRGRGGCGERAERIRRVAHVPGPGWRCRSGRKPRAASGGRAKGPRAGADGPRGPGAVVGHTRRRPVGKRRVVGGGGGDSIGAGDARGLDRGTRTARRAGAGAPRRARAGGSAPRVADRTRRGGRAPGGRSKRKRPVPRRSTSERWRASSRRRRPRLAADLVQGVPCPVCGSTEHPSPAQLTDGKAVDHEQVDTSRTAWTKASSKAEQARAVVSAKQAELGGDAELSVETFVAAVEVAEVGLNRATQASVSLVAARQTLEARARDLADAVDRERRKAEEVVALDARVAMERDAVAVAVEAARGLDAVQIESSTVRLRSLKKSSANHAQRYDAANKAESEHQAVDGQLRESLAAEGYETLEVARQHLLKEDAERRSFDDANAWEAGVAKHGVRLQQLREQGVPEVRPDLESLADELARATARATEAERTFTTAWNAVQTAREAMKALSVRATETADPARAAHHRTDRVQDLQRGGRHQGQARAVGAGRGARSRHERGQRLPDPHDEQSLPARARQGEQGRALARSVRRTHGARAFAGVVVGRRAVPGVAGTRAWTGGRGEPGRRWRAASSSRRLFVDEGFGSLDPDSLDDAIYALSMLRATGRVVGVITHVEAMKERLHVGIEVRRLGDGRGSTLVVNP